MVKPAHSLQQSLECLRLESACKELAERVRDPDLQMHFIERARFWNDAANEHLANESPGQPNVADMVAANVRAA